MKLSEKFRALDGQVQIYPTTRGWTVRALYWTEGQPDPYWGYKPKKHHQKKWTNIPDIIPGTQTHTRSYLNEAIGKAIDWLDKEADKHDRMG